MKTLSPVLISGPANTSTTANTTPTAGIAVPIRGAQGVAFHFLATAVGGAITVTVEACNDLAFGAGVKTVVDGSDGFTWGAAGGSPAPADIIAAGLGGWVYVTFNQTGNLWMPWPYQFVRAKIAGTTGLTAMSVRGYRIDAPFTLPQSPGANRIVVPHITLAGGVLTAANSTDLAGIPVGAWMIAVSGTASLTNASVVTGWTIADDGDRTSGSVPGGSCSDATIAFVW